MYKAGYVFLFESWKTSDLQFLALKLHHNSYHYVWYVQTEGNDTDMVWFVEKFISSLVTKMHSSWYVHTKSNISDTFVEKAPEKYGLNTE